MRLAVLVPPFECSTLVGTPPPRPRGWAVNLSPFDTNTLLSSTVLLEDIFDDILEATAEEKRLEDPLLSPEVTDTLELSTAGRLVQGG